MSNTFHDFLGLHEHEDIIERNTVKAERIGRLAADEFVTHEQAHQIAARTAVLAHRDTAREVGRFRLSKQWWLILAAAAVVAVLSIQITPAQPGTPSTAQLHVSAVGIYLFSAWLLDLTVGNPLNRFLPRLPRAIRRFIAPSYEQIECEVLWAFDEQSRILGMPGCSCENWDGYDD